MKPVNFGEQHNHPICASVILYREIVCIPVQFVFTKAVKGGFSLVIPAKLLKTVLQKNSIY
jgi:hypothetical protein